MLLVGSTSAPHSLLFLGQVGAHGMPFSWQIAGAQKHGQKCMMLLEIVNPGKNYICQNDLLMVNWAQIHNQSLVAVAERGLSHTAFWKKP